MHLHTQKNLGNSESFLELNKTWLPILLTRHLHSEKVTSSSPHPYTYSFGLIRSCFSNNQDGGQGCG